MNRTEQSFFALLRAGLWNSPIEEKLFTDAVNWELLLKMASMQTVCGVLYEGIQKLPSEQQPSTHLMRKLYQRVIRMEQSHGLLNQGLTEVVTLLNLAGIDSILLKGQGVAQNYPIPVRRQCGDIDLFVGKEACERACKVLLDGGAKPRNGVLGKNVKHESFYWNEICIELHFLAEKLPNPFENRRFQVWTAHWLQKEKLRVWKLGEAFISLPPVQFDALYIFNHLYHHFIVGGVGLRQLCDWAMYLHTFKDEIDREELLKDLKSMGLLKPWQVFGCIVVDALGLSVEDFPFYEEKQRKNKQKIWKVILRLGNFGYYNPDRGGRPDGFFAGKYHSLKLHHKNLLKILPVFPGEVIMAYLELWRRGILNIIHRLG